MCVARLVGAALLLLGAGASATSDLEVAGGRDLAAKNRPVTKVVNLMKDMIKQLEKEGEEDQEIFENIGCWCTTNEKEKTKAVADAAERITVLQSTIETNTADSARLNAEVGQLKKELAENTGALDEATKLREKQAAEFVVEEKETIQSVSSLKGAVQVLSKTNEGASLLQVSGAQELTRMNAMNSVRKIFRKHSELFAESISPGEKHLLE